MHRQFISTESKSKPDPKETLLHTASLGFTISFWFKQLSEAWIPPSILGDCLLQWVRHSGYKQVFPALKEWFLSKILCHLPETILFIDKAQQEKKKMKQFSPIIQCKTTSQDSGNACKFSEYNFETRSSQAQALLLTVLTNCSPRHSTVRKGIQAIGCFV